MRLARIAFLIALLPFVASGQQDSETNRPVRGERIRDMDRVMGTIVSISGDALLVKQESGDNVQVKIGPETRIRKDRADAKLSDFKAGERIFAAGKMNTDKTLSAEIVGGGEMRGPGMMIGGPRGHPPSPEEMVKRGLGTKFIAGEVKSIDETKLTILRLDNQTQTIEVDESTSFRIARGESGTLADIKVGDHVFGEGEVKNGTFVPQTLRVGRGGMMMRYGGSEGERHSDAPPQQPK
jgi:Domain of unknown function (DUF5666)